MRKKITQILEYKQKAKEMERKNMAKLGDTLIHTETVEGQEVNFRIQHIGVRETLKLIKRTDKDIEKMINEVIANVAFFEDGTKITWDYFEEIENGLEVAANLTKAAISFLTGKSEDE